MLEASAEPHSLLCFALYRHASDRAAVEAAVRSAFCVVTATGVPAVISKSYDTSAFSSGVCACVRVGCVAWVCGVGKPSVVVGAVVAAGCVTPWLWCVAVWAAYLANMGAVEEFGPAFDKSSPRLLFQGRAVNFALEEPTTIQYLDPAFVSHNASAELLMKPGSVAALGPGVHALPLEIDDSVLASWQSYHAGRDAELLKVILGAR